MCLLHIQGNMFKTISSSSWVTFTMRIPGLQNVWGQTCTDLNSPPAKRDTWALGFLWKEWGWSGNSSPLATSSEELTHWKRLWCWEGWGQEEKGTTKDEMAGWHHWLDGHESEWTLGVDDGQGGLMCCDSWALKESDMTEQLNWTELMQIRLISGILI